VFYGPEQAAIHHERFGDLARDAAALVLQELIRADLRAGTVVDLGCGTGIFARIVGDAGYDVFGVDLSPAMVELARANAPAATFAVGSLHDTTLPPAVAVTALGEVCNYATDARVGIDALGSLAARVRGALAPGGLFVFDVATPGRGAQQQRFVTTDGWSIGVLMREDGDTLERAITIFTRDADEHYRRVDEHHVLRLYEPDAGGVAPHLGAQLGSATRCARKLVRMRAVAPHTVSSSRS
jgi:SAM-dependent methyltransferase